MKYDVVVLGLGGLGASILRATALAGLKVLGIEAKTPAHSASASSGETRLFRRAYFEGEAYVSLVEESHTLWRNLEAECSQELFTPCGFVTLGPPQDTLRFENLLNISKRFGFRSEILATETLREQFPAFEIPNGFRGFWEPDAGFLRVEACVEALLESARSHGADIQASAVVQELKIDSNGVSLRCNGQNIQANRIVLALGAWLPVFLQTHLTRHSLPLALERAPVCWFEGSAPFPQSCFAFQTGGEFIYGFPSLDGRHIKIARYKSEASVAHPDARGEISPEEVRPIVECVEEYLKRVNPTPTVIKNCLYTSTPDENFLMGFLEPRVFVAGGDSGHAFKMAPALGQIVARSFVSGNDSAVPSLFQLKRF